MGEAKLRAVEDGEVLPPSPHSLREELERERRRAALLEQVVIDQLAAIGLAIDNIMVRLAALEQNAKPKSAIIKLRDV